MGITKLTKRSNIKRIKSTTAKFILITNENVRPPFFQRWAEVVGCLGNMIAHNPKGLWAEVVGESKSYPIGL